MKEAYCCSETRMQVRDAKTKRGESSQHDEKVFTAVANGN